MATSESGLNLFDETASAAGSFPRARRGYDMKVVDDYVLTLEDQAAGLRRRVRDLEQELEEARASASTNSRAPAADFSSLGAHTTTLLTSAEQQAGETTAQAGRDADKLRDQARREAAEIVDAGRAEADDIRLTALAEVDQIRARMDDTIAEQVRLTREDGDTLLANARTRAETILQEANARADALAEDARLEAAQIRQAAESEAADVRRAALAAREELLATMKAEHEDLTRRMTALLDDAGRRSDEAHQRVRDDLDEAARVRSQAAADADAMMARAARTSEIQLKQAREQAEAAIRASQDRYAEHQEQIRRETDLLQQRRQAILVQLAHLSQLATTTAAQFPGADGTEDSSADSSQGGGHESADRDGADQAEHTLVLDAVAEDTEPTLTVTRQQIREQAKGTNGQ